ncbi:MAG: hypothetical protein ABIZ70_09090 [Gemmatimonadales bacterium]
MPTYFTDRDLGRRFPELLRAAGRTVHASHEIFAPNTPDAEWIAEVSKRGWVAITHDGRIRYKPNEQAAVRAAGLSLLVLVGNATTTELAENFLRTRARIERFIDRNAPPFIAAVLRPSPADLARRPNAAGRVELRWPKP